MANDVLGSRRHFLKTAGLALGAGFIPTLAGYGSSGGSGRAGELTGRPLTLQGVQFGDMLADRAVVWSRSDGPARMVVEYGFKPDFSDAGTLPGPLALPGTDYTARLDLSGLPSGREVYVRVLFRDLDNPKIFSEPLYGRFRTAPEDRRDVRFLWSGDTCGQGWGINPDIGGMRIFEAMRRTAPDFFIHCGDSIYADSPIPESQIVPQTGAVWNNLVIPEVAKVAETLDEFRGRYKYNLLDDNLRRFNAEVPTVWLWDDHEITNNWSPSKDLGADPRYAEKSIAKLVERGRRAAFEYAPMRLPSADAAGRIYRKLSYGPLLDVFALDMRSYRGGNNCNDQARPGPETCYLGREQLDWLKAGLKRSAAVWKVIAADMPLGLQSLDGVDGRSRPQFESVANGDGPVRGREFELAELLAFLKREGIANTVWLTADVHYAAAHFYEPAKARFKDFEPFWEFVAGPLNAGSFGPHELDDTFGPQVIFQKASPVSNLSPLLGLQSFGQVDVDGRSGVMTVVLKDGEGNALYTGELVPAWRKRGPK
ncbi:MULTISPECIES: alkaline phosphatase D family protein [Methylomicrobium]|uniref:Phosphodiesterase/alkaline phosphatase D n=1 Tax=Methylomicrobium album BG8 TaxID=686340 RepID=H8GIN6_METAL|nr:MULTISPECIES: alkaline phosphatase D family protein [Methylomicrobium]EIC29063.1 phosphodiesterase/alkaline phosphatase D [Methylomicrobium album BG8]